MPLSTRPTTKATLAAFALCLLAAAGNAAHAGRYRDDHAAITQAVFTYFDALGTADRAALETVFDKHATMSWVMTTDGQQQLVSRPITDVIDRWASNENPPGAGRDGEILSINAVNGQLATVMFRYTDDYYDALTLMKIAGQWKITAKFFVEQ